MRSLKQDYSDLALSEGIQKGNLLIHLCSGWETAAGHLRELATAKFGDHFAGLHRPDLDGKINPELLAYARQVAIEGVPARFSGPTPERVTSKPHASAKDHLPEAAKQLWKDGSKGRVLLCSGLSPELMRGVISVPLARVPKMNPDRTVSESGRIVWDARFPNQGCAKEDHPPALQPRHREVARLLAWWAYRLPGIRLLLAKKDVAEAFKWLWVLLKDVGMFAADLPGEPFGLGSDIWTAIYTCLTFGWSGSPGEFMIFAWVIKQLHSAFTPECAAWNDTVPFFSFFLMDDQVLIEPDIGLRPFISLALSREAITTVMGPGAINEEKDLEEGTMETQKIIWGLRYDTEARTVSLPSPKLEKAHFLLWLPEFDQGNTKIPLRLVQELRGNQQFWLAVLPVLAPYLSATDSLLAGADSQGNARPRGSDAARERAFREVWEAVDLQRVLVSTRNLPAPSRRVPHSC